MNRKVCPDGIENALLLRAEHHQALGETSEALQYRRFAQCSRRTKRGNSRTGRFLWDETKNL